MGKTVASLGIDLYANSARLVKDLQKSKKNTKRWARDVKKAASAALKTFAVGSTLAAGALTVLTKESLKNLDSLGKLSDRYNINTKDLAALRHQAELSGTSYQTLDKSIGKMVKSIGEASQGTGEAIRYAKLLNINLEETKKLDAGSQYQLIAEKIAGLENATDKAAAANAFFGRSGIDMLNQLNQGAEGFKAAREEAEALGLSVSRFDAKQIEEANDSITRMKRVATGLGNTIAVKVAPFIKAIADRFTEAGKESKGFQNQVESGMKIAAKVIGFVADRAQDLSRGMVTIAIAAKAVKIGFITLLDKIAPKKDGTLTDLDDELSSLQKSIESLTNSVDGGRISDRLNAEIEAIKEKSIKARNEFENEISKPSSSQAQVFKDPVIGDKALEDLQKQLKRATDLRQKATMSQTEFERIQEQTKHAERLANLALLREQEGIDLATFNEGKELAEQIHQERLTAITKKEAEDRAKLEQNAQNQIASMRQNVQNLGLGLLGQFAQRSKKTALLLLAIETARGAKQAIINSQVAATRALAELGPIAGPPVAAKMVAYGKIAAGLIVASGALEAATSFGGGGADFGAPNNSSFTGNNLPDEDQEQGTGTGQTVQIIVQGSLVGVNEATAIEFGDLIKDAMSNKDYVLIEAGTAQASELSSG